MSGRKVTEKDSPMIIEKIFSVFDKDNNGRFTRREFPKVIKTLVDLFGGDEATEDDIDDIFNLLDVNGDETIDKKEFHSLIRMLIRVLDEKEIQLTISVETDLIL